MSLLVVRGGFVSRPMIYYQVRMMRRVAFQGKRMKEISCLALSGARAANLIH